MPSVGLPIGGQGVLVQVYVGVSTARLAALNATNMPAPDPVPCMLLVDTGASSTNLCTSVVGKFGISPTGSILVHTPSTGTNPVAMDQFDVNLYIQMGTIIPGRPAPLHQITNLPITATDFTSQGIQGLLGRDVLQRASLTYHGYMGICSLSF